MSEQYPREIINPAEIPDIPGDRLMEMAFKMIPSALHNLGYP
jgi:hypothetical protein